MRILSVTAQKPHSTGSGVYLTELVKGFAGLGHQQAVIAGVCRDDAADFPEGVEFYPVYFQSEALPFPIAGMSDEMPYESTVYRRMTPDMAARFKAAFVEAVKQAVEAFQPDLILCHHLYLLTALIREQFPGRMAAAVCHGTGLRQLMTNPLEKRYILDNLRRLDRVFVLHEAQKKTALELTGIEAKRVSVIGSGFNDRVFRRVNLAREPGSILYAGKLAEKKGVMSLLRAVDLIEGAVTVKLAGGAGNGEEEQEIRALAQRCRHPVVFLGRLEQTRLAEEFNRGTLFVLPSFYEGLPLVLIEALACGLRVVSTDLPGVREWMEENIPGNGIRYVALPPMRGADEPVEAYLPAFERDLARCMMEAIAGTQNADVDLRGATWDGVCARILTTLSTPPR